MDPNERRRRILDAARQLILHYGYDKTTVSDIAREAGVSKGAIYLHFSSKEALLDALIEHDMQQYTADIMAAMEADGTAWSFVSIYQISLGLLRNYPMVMALVRDDGRLGSYYKKATIDLQQLKRRSRYPLLQAMQDVGALRDDVDMRDADILLSLIGYGVIHADDAVPDAAPLDFDRLLTTLGTMLESWLVPADGGDREAGRLLVMQMLAAYRDGTLGATAQDQADERSEM